VKLNASGEPLGNAWAIVSGIARSCTSKPTAAVPLSAG
jgi:hypothetical protein